MPSLSEDADSPEGHATVEDLLEEFEQNSRAGQQPDINEFLARASVADKDLLAAALIKREFEAIRRAGAEVDLPSLLARFPQHTDEVQRLFRTATAFDTAGSVQLPAPTIIGTEDTDEGTPSEDPAPRFGDYELLEEIARGGMGVVYRARQVSLNRTVALKMILSGQLAAEAEIQRFRVEAEAAARLDHPGIVPIFEVGEEDGRHYFSMGFVDGDSLETKLQPGPLSQKEAAQVLTDVAEAVAYAHAHGVLHRDIKPANILIDSAGVPRVTDFGLAKQLDNATGVTATGDVLGTPAYMSPEQALGQNARVGPQSDVYSLGAVLYCSVTGRAPFQAATIVDTLRQVVEQDPVSPSRLNGSLSRDIETICLKCLEKQASQRYASAADLADDLKRFSRGEPIHARPAGTLERSWRWCVRNPTVTALAVAFVLALVAGTIGSTTFAWRASRSAELMRQEKNRADDAARSEREARQLAQQRAETARAEAKRADENADKMRSALYSSLTERVRTLLAQRSEPGWSWEALSALDEASRLRAADRAATVDDAAELRSLYAGALGSTDVRPLEVVAHDIDASVIVWSPSGRYLAVGQRKHAAWCTVHLYDPTGQTLLKRLSFSTISNSFSQLFQGTRKYQDGIKSLVFSPDERWLVAGTRFGRLVRWDLTEASPEAIAWQGHQADANRVAFSADGAQLYSCGSTGGESDSGEVRLWDTNAEWQEIDRPSSSQLDDLCIDDHSGLIAGVYEGRLTLAEPLSLYPNAAWPRRVDASWCALSPDHREIIGVSGSSTRLVSRFSGTLLEELTTPGGASIRYLSTSPDGALLVLGDLEQNLHLLHVGGLQPPVTLSVPGRDEPIGSVAPNGRLMAVAANRETQICEVRGHSLDAVQRLLARHPVAPEAMSLSADGRRLAVTGRASDWHPGAECQIVTVWDVASGKHLRETRFFGYPHDGRFPKNYTGDTVWLPDDQSLLWTPPFLPPTDSGGMWSSAPLQDPAWQASQGRIVLQEDAFVCDEHPQNCELVDDPAASDGRALRVTGETDVTRVRLEPDSLHPAEHAYAVILAFKIEAEGSTGNALTLTAAGKDGSDTVNLELFRVPPDEYHLFDAARIPAGHQGPFHIELSLSPDSANVQSLLLDRCELLPIGTSREVQRSAYESMCPAEDGRMLWAIADDSSVVAWDRNSGRIKSRWDNSMARLMTGVGELHSLSVSRQCVLAGRRDGATQLLDSTDGTPLRLLPSLGAALRSVACCRNTPRIVAGSENGVIGMFDPLTGEQLHQWEAHSDSVEALAWNDAGSLLVSGSRDGTIRLWRCGPESAEQLVTLTDVGEIRDVQLSSNGQTLAVLLGDDRWIHIWHLDRLRKELGRRDLDW